MSKKVEFEIVEGPQMAEKSLLLLKLKGKLEWLDSREGKRAEEIKEQLERDYGMPLKTLRVLASIADMKERDDE